MPKKIAERSEIRKNSRILTKAEMREWLEITAMRQGVAFSAAQFRRTLLENLPKESEYQAEVMEAIRGNFPSSFVWKAAAGPYSRQGIPDVCAVIDGRFFGFEIKRPYIGQLSKIQEQTIKAIQRAGGIAAVVSFGEDAVKIIKNAEVQK